MDTQAVETVLMHGPDLKDPSKVIEREVPKADIQAYRASGYQMGGDPYKEFATVGVTYSDEDAAAQAADEPAPVSAKRSRRGK